MGRLLNFAVHMPSVASDDLTSFVSRGDCCSGGHRAILTLLGGENLPQVVYLDGASTHCGVVLVGSPRDIAEILSVHAIVG